MRINLEVYLKVFFQDFTGNYEDLDDSDGLDSGGQGYAGQRVC